MDQITKEIILIGLLILLLIACYFVYKWSEKKEKEDTRTEQEKWEDNQL